MLKTLLERALKELNNGQSTTLAVITEAQGSTPRGVGAAMLVRDSRVLAGTIGGGELEYRCAQIAEAPDSPVVEFQLNNEAAADLGMVCGGSAKVLFMSLDDRDILEKALNTANVGLLLPLDGGKPIICKIVANPELTADGLLLPLSDPGRIFLMGGGHVSLALAKLLDVLGYDYIVVDDRPEFSGKDRFPKAHRAFVSDFADLGGVLRGELQPGERDCVCIMTRGHLADTEALRFALGTPAGYIGLMGSRKKRERVFERLTAEGFADAPARIVTPIGLPIGGQTPEEVAVSIAAQLVEFRNKK